MKWTAISLDKVLCLVYIRCVRCGQLYIVSQSQFVRSFFPSVLCWISNNQFFSISRAWFLFTGESDIQIHFVCVQKRKKNSANESLHKSVVSHLKVFRVCTSALQNTVNLALRLHKKWLFWTCFSLFAIDTSSIYMV